MSFIGNAAFLFELCGPLDLVPAMAEALWDILLGKLVVYFAGACFFGGLVIPLLIIQDIKGLVELAYLLLNGTALLFDKLFSLGNGAVALMTPVHELLYVLDGHSRFFQAAYHCQSFHIGGGEYAYAPFGTLHRRQQTLFIVISQGRGGDVKASCGFSYSVIHIITRSYKIKILTIDLKSALRFII